MKTLSLLITASIALVPSQAWSAQPPSAGGVSPLPLTLPVHFRSVTSPNVVFRAQSGDVPIPPGAQNAAATESTTAGVTDSGGMQIPTTEEPTTWNAFSPQIGSDPFVQDPALGGTMPYTPYAPYSPYAPGAMGSPYTTQPFAMFGTNGLRPYRNGWSPKLDIEWMPSTGISQGGRGDFGQFGVDYDMAYTGPFMPGWVLTWTNQFRLRSWDGPDGVTPGPGLPGSAFRFGIDFEVETPSAGPISWTFGITPSLNTDFDASPGSASFQLDGRGMVVLRADQYWSIVLGAAYWDRVDDRVIPYAGVVYRDDFWEWRIMYPETTVSVFLGNGPAGAAWMYARAEYHVEGYEVRTTTGTDEVELEDYRAVLGVRTDNGYSSWFIEGGWVFEREIDYASAINPAFNPNTGFILRSGWRY